MTISMRRSAIAIVRSAIAKNGIAVSTHFVDGLVPVPPVTQTASLVAGDVEMERVFDRRRLPGAKAGVNSEFESP
jgi:hypothetical protein